MSHPPESIIGECAETESPKSTAEQNRYFGGQDRHKHIDDQWNRRQPGQQPNQNKRPADDLDDADERRHDLRRRNADLREAPGAVFSRIEEFLNAFQKEDSTNYKADEYYRSRGVSSNDVAAQN